MLVFFSDNYLSYSAIIILLSLISFQARKEKLALSFLFIGSILLGIFIARLDPFINLWDEQFHALVAKNMIAHPLKSILIEEPLFSANQLHWTSAHIWLHKQPLFLWQMALSINIIGLTEIGIRFPSILMHAIMIFFIYRVGKIFASKKTGYYAALFFTCAYFPLEYITGFYATDHNDIAFYFYAFASIWALIEYYDSKKIIFLVLIGVLSGAAILCKWLIGLLVFGLWFILICYNHKREGFLKETIKLISSFLICLVVFLPWQIYTYINYPPEFMEEMAFNSKHISEPLEGHGGNYAFYFNALFEQFGEGLLIAPAILICFIAMIYFIKNKNHQLITISSFVIVYLFFTLVKTKMYGYVMVIFPFFILGIAYAFNALVEKINIKIKRTYLQIIITNALLLISILFLFNSNKLYKHHSNLECGRYKSRLIDVREKQLFIGIKEKFGDKKCLIFNCHTSLQSHILAIFYTNYPSYNIILTQEQISIAKKLNFKLISIDDGSLPNYIKSDKSITKIGFKPF